MRVEDLPPFLRIEEARELTQLSRAQIYAQTQLWRRSGGQAGIPVVAFGRCLRVPTAPLLRMAGIEVDDDNDGHGG